MAKQDIQRIVVGVDQFDAQLSRLEAFAQSDVLKRSAKAAMEPVAAEAARLAPKKSGALAKAIRTRAGKSGRGMFSWIAGAASRWFTGKTFYGAFQEFGWKHGRRPTRAQKRTSTFVDQRKDIAGRHFVERGFKNKAQAALDSFTAAVKANLEKEARGK